MKKIIFFVFIIILNFSVFGQSFDPPSQKTQYYKLRMWAQHARPSADSLNANWKDIDSLLNELIVFTNEYQLQIINDTLKFSPTMSGTDYFTSGKQFDTVSVSGITPSDIVIITLKDITPSNTRLLSVYTYTNYFIVERPSPEAEIIWYNWLWIKK